MTSSSIVVSAYAANPYVSGESAVGADIILLTAQVARHRGLSVLAITNHRSAPDLRAEIMRKHLSSTVRVEEVGPNLRPLIARHIPHRLQYLAWLIAARKILSKYPANILYHHHVTFASELTPPPFNSKAQAFRVWGPVGSKQNPEVHLVSRLGPQRWPYFVLHKSLSFLKPPLLAINAWISKADLVLTQTRTSVPHRRGVKIQHFPNTVVASSEHDLIVDKKTLSAPSIKILCVARIIPLKRLEIAIEVMVRQELSDATLTIVGQSPARANYLLRIAHDLGVADRVHFPGALSRDSVLSQMHSATVLLHPSSSEGAAAVVGEAVSVGLPVVCFDRTGAADSLRLCGGAGVVVCTKTPDRIGAVVKAVIDASQLPSAPPSTFWSEDRMRSRIDSIVDLAAAQQTKKRK